MATKSSSLPLGYPVYTWVADHCGTNIHIDAKRLREWVIKRKPKQHITPVDPEFAAGFIANNAVDPIRVLQLMVEVEMGARKLDPIILCQLETDKLEALGLKFSHKPPDAILVDGRHRYTIAAIKKWPFIPCHLLQVQQWWRFRITGHPDFTQEVLKAAPLGQRNY